MNGGYGDGAYGGASHLPEGLPKVNETYAPSAAAYVSGTAEEAHVLEDVAEEAPPPPTATYESPVSEASAVRPAPLDLDAEEGTPHPPQEDFTHGSASVDLVESPSSAPVPASSPPTTSHSQPRSQTVHPPAGPSSPQKTVSPPRSSSTAPQYTTQVATGAYDPYAPTSRSNASDRAKSPGASSVRSVASLQKQAYDPPPRRDSTAANTSPTLTRPLSSQSRRSTYSNPYEPHAIAELKRTASPASSIHSVVSHKQNAYDPYAPANGVPTTRERATSNGSVYSTTSVSDPYAPSRHPARQSSEHTYGSFVVPPTTYAPSAAPAPSVDRSGAQYVTLAPPVHSTYAPSPSLLGTNDPLGRTSARVPVISFGFGGKLVTCFHGANMNTGFDVALSARQSTDIKIHSLDKVIPESALDTSATAYPGPLYSDPGSPTASLVRTGAQVVKAKKAKVIKYLEDRAAEMAAGLGYHRPGTEERSRIEAKRTLVLLLKVMVENDGRLSGR